MGFSVSGSAAIIFVALFIGFGMFYTAASNGYERVSDARQDRGDRALTQANTAMTVTSADWHAGNTTLLVTANNTGATSLSLADVDLLANNSYLTGYATSVDGDETTELWVPGETLTINVTSLDTDPDRIKLVTGPGVADTEVTT